MKVPGTMTTPPMKLADGEQVLQIADGMRRKGIFGNRYGQLYVTNQRVAFVKAIMRGVVASIVGAVGVKPMLAFDRAAITADKQPLKKQLALVISDGNRSERFVIDEPELDGVLAALRG